MARNWKKSALMVFVSTLGLMVGMTTLCAAEGDAPGQEMTVLADGSYWRCHFTWKTASVRMETGLVEVGPQCDSPLPPAGWKQVDFDDGGWSRVPGLFPASSSDTALGLICLRGKFSVSDPGRVEGLTLSLAYRGGIVVHVNGKELTRRHLPAGDIDLATLADDYPEEAYVAPDGKVIGASRGDREKYQDRIARRTRTLEKLVIPSSMLRKGVNLLALEVHRAPFAGFVVAKDRKGSLGFKRKEVWGTIGLSNLHLQAPADAPVQPNMERPKGFQVWTSNPLEAVFDVDYGDSNEPLAALEVVGALNGAFSGQVVVGSDQPIRGLEAKMSDLKIVGGKGLIPASMVQVCYPQPGWTESGAESRYPGIRNVLRFDLLAEVAPEEVPVRVKELARGVSRTPTFGAVQPIWITVDIPAEASAGNYEGTLTISARGQESVDVPVTLQVAGWKLPHPSDWETFVGLIQPPASVALKYNVPLWSDEHFQLVEKSFALIAKIGGDTVYLPLICRTNFGNSESMVRWVKQSDGSFAFDYTIFDRYLNLALKHLNPRVICLYLWDNYTGVYYWGKTKMASKGRAHWDTVLVSLLDPASGKVTEMTGPGYDDVAESEAFWKPLLMELRQRLAERGLLDSVMFGLVWDNTPRAEAVQMLNRLWPEASWVKHAHGGGSKLYGVPIGYVAHVWGAQGPVDPDLERRHGWDQEQYNTQFDRPRTYTCPLTYYRLFGEWNIAGRQRGFGRRGADFWPVIEGPRGLRRIANRYVQSDWGNRNIFQPDWLAPGPKGAISTIRFETVREGIQECEARIFIEKALVDETQRAKLGEELAARAQQILDARTRYIIWEGLSGARRFQAHLGSVWYPGSGWQQRSVQLFSAAAEVAEALK